MIPDSGASSLRMPLAPNNYLQPANQVVPSSLAQSHYGFRPGQQKVSQRTNVIMNALPSNKDSYNSLEGVPQPKIEPEEEKPKFGLRAWLVLAMVIMVRVMVQSQRAIFSFAYGYTGVGAQAGSTVYELGSAYP